jgi:hypothetical protein
MLVKPVEQRRESVDCRAVPEGDEPELRHLLIAVAFFAAVLVPTIVAIQRGMRITPTPNPPPESSEFF